MGSALALSPWFPSLAFSFSLSAGARRAAESASSFFTALTTYSAMPVPRMRKSTKPMPKIISRGERLAGSGLSLSPRKEGGVATGAIWLGGGAYGALRSGALGARATDDDEARGAGPPWRTGIDVSQIGQH